MTFTQNDLAEARKIRLALLNDKSPILNTSEVFEKLVGQALADRRERCAKLIETLTAAPTGRPPTQQEIDRVALGDTLAAAVRADA